VHPTALTFITASDDKTVRLWDLNTKAMVCQKQLDHSARSADFSPDGAHVAVGMKNGEFLVLSATDLSVTGRRRDRSKTIEAVRFSPDSGKLAVGSDDACVDIYSLSPSVSRVAYCRGIPSFVTQLDWSQNGRHLQVSTGVYERLVFEVASGKQITSSDVINKITWASWTSVLGEEVVGVWPRNADKADVNTAHLNHSGTAVATGDDFGCLKLFTQFPLTEKFAPHKKFFGHSAHVTNVKFTHDDRYLLSAGGDDSCVFVWKCITADV
jgi:WD40 repeat protein